MKQDEMSTIIESNRYPNVERIGTDEKYHYFRHPLLGSIKLSRLSNHILFEGTLIHFDMSWDAADILEDLENKCRQAVSKYV